MFGHINVHREECLRKGESTLFLDYVLDGITQASAKLEPDAVYAEADRFLKRYGDLTFNTTTKLYDIGVQPYTPDPVILKAQFEKFVLDVQKIRQRESSHHGGNQGDGSGGGGGACGCVFCSGNAE